MWEYDWELEQAIEEATENEVTEIIGIRGGWVSREERAEIERRVRFVVRIAGATLKKRKEFNLVEAHELASPAVNSLIQKTIEENLGRVLLGLSPAQRQAIQILLDKLESEGL